MALFASVQKDIKWRLSDPVALVMWIGIPVLIGGMMGLVFGGGNPAVKVKLLLADQDDNFITEAISSAANQTGVLQVEKVTEAAGRRRIGEGDGSAFLVIPDGQRRTGNWLGTVLSNLPKVNLGNVANALVSTLATHLVLIGHRNAAMPILPGSLYLK